MNRKTILTTLLALIAFTLASCGSSEPEWADPEAHEKMELLQKQYVPFIVGTWHYESIQEKQRVFEQLTFNADGKFYGQRKWQRRQLVTIDGEERYTDWEKYAPTDGTFSGKWSLLWERNDKGVGENRLFLYAQYDEEGEIAAYLPYSTHALFDHADATTLRFAGWWLDSDGWTSYQRGAAEPSF